MEDGEGGYQRFVIEELNYEKVIDETIDQTIEGHPSNIIYTPVPVRQNTEAEPDLTSAIKLQPIVTAEESNGLTYVWYKNPDNHAVQKEDFNPADLNRPEGLKDSEWAEQERLLIAEHGWSLIEGANNPVYKATEEGCYAVKVKNSFNADNRETNLFDAGICRVTQMPQEPEIVN